MLKSQPLKIIDQEAKGTVLQKPAHGGNALAMCREYNIDFNDCVDLTAAINPNPYPTKDIPSSIWQHLPQDDDGLEQAAAVYYGLAVDECFEPQWLKQNFLMLPGSSWAIHALPFCFELKKKRTVWVPLQGFAEHAYAWQKNGFNTQTYHDFPDANKMGTGDICVLINPNNPTGKRYNHEVVKSLLAKIEALNGYLIVDEAFMDPCPECSVMILDSSALIVMRSFGKFFGLAGIRLGALKANPQIISHLKDSLPPWAVSSPARYIAQKAYEDTFWHGQAFLYLKQQGDRLYSLLNSLKTAHIRSFPISSFSYLEVAQSELVRSCLFQTLFLPQADQLHQRLAEQGIFTRLLDNKTGIRFGLPNENEFTKVSEVIGHLID